MVRRGHSRRRRPRVRHGVLRDGGVHRQRRPVPLSSRLPGSFLLAHAVSLVRRGRRVLQSPQRACQRSFPVFFLPRPRDRTGSASHEGSLSTAQLAFADLDAEGNQNAAAAYVSGWDSDMVRWRCGGFARARIATRAVDHRYPRGIASQIRGCACENTKYVGPREKSVARRGGYDCMRHECVATEDPRRPDRNDRTEEVQQIVCTVRSSESTARDEATKAVLKSDRLLCVRLDRRRAADSASGSRTTRRRRCSSTMPSWLGCVTGSSWREREWLWGALFTCPR